jgi:Sulfotransferase family
MRVTQPVLDEAEAALFDRLLAGRGAPTQSPVVFVLGSPRTGSTRVYQALARFLRWPYFSNLANDAFPRHPILAGLALREVWPSLEVALDARYGKTRGAFQPSEASAIMTHWCGGGHPSAVVSPGILPGREVHLARTVSAMHALFAAPVLIKNAWHCFRIPSLAAALPAAHFVWVRRDLTASALSDLASRYVTRGDPEAWNSATPANIDALRRLPYWAQVVENQFQFALAVRSGLSEFAAGRHSVVWFEDLVRDPTGELRRVADDLAGVGVAVRPADVSLGRGEKTEKPLRPGDEDNLLAYVEAHRDRLADCRYPGRG